MQNEKIKRLLREPLLHFLLIGVGLFGLYSIIQPKVLDDSNRIVVTSSQKDLIAAQFTRTWLRPPSEEEFNSLIESYVRDEVYYREAIALGLDQNDTQIRQRMRQKLDFILDDLTTEESNKDTLLLFLQQHPDRFMEPAQNSFQQLYLNPDKHQDLSADAAIMLKNLLNGAIPEKLDDPTMLAYSYIRQTQSEIARQFGKGFALEVEKLVPGEWSGPIYSGFGAHLIKVTERVPGRLPELIEIHNKISYEYLAQRRIKKKEIAYQKMLESYEVVIEQVSPGAVANKNVTSPQVKDVNK